MSARPPFARTIVPWIVGCLFLIAAAYFVADKFRASGHSAPAAEAVSDKSVAVLPFADMSEKHDQEYFTDGLAEELINRLAQTQKLKVIARTSSFQFKGKSDDLRAIAAKLSVANLVEGSIRRSGAHIRITVQLVRAADGTPIWSQSYDREDRDALKVQDEIAGSVANALSVSLHADSAATPSMTDAYVLYLRGRELADHGVNSETNVGAAMDLIEQAVKLDPKLGIAYANLSRIRLGIYLDFPQSYDRRAVGALALNEAERALELAPQLAESHVARARVMMWIDWDWSEAAKEMELALQLEPGNATVQRNARYLSTFLGQWDEALQHARRATEIDPLSGQNFRRLASAQMMVQAFADSEKSWRITLKLDPYGAGLHSELARALWYEGRHQDAVVESGLETDQASRLAMTAFLQFKLGRSKESTQALNEFVETYGRSTPFDVGSLYADIGHLDEAFLWWNRAFSEHDAKVTYLLEATRDPELPNIGSDPRFKALVKRLRLPE
jgi:TolB-like protein/Tfp pilus assembly protein PilF